MLTLSRRDNEAIKRMNGVVSYTSHVRCKAYPGLCVIEALSQKLARARCFLRNYSLCR
ncbi:MAG: hypothetical protein ACJAWL_000172 [Motiliproteus sp.]|jgi:hypothetical protein